MPHTRINRLRTKWPVPPFQVVLVEPEIPPNTGTIARLCAATGTRLHLVGPLGFRLTDSAVRRAGLDYWQSVDLARHRDYAAFATRAAGGTCYYFSTGGGRSYLDVSYRPGDYLVFGNESQGLPDALLNAHPDAVLGIPIMGDRVRSLNLANAVAIALYEALRQVSRR